MNQKLDLFRKVFEEYLKRSIFSDRPAELYAPINYIMQIGGKRMRPVLVLAGAAAFTDEWKKALPAALGFELFHNFTLLHDDIMDNALVRRGRPAGHVKFGRNSAILSGDAMMLKSLQFVKKACTGQQESLMMDYFLSTALEVCIGQQQDMNFEQIECPSLSEYIEMIKGKTAVLPAECLRIGAMIGGASEQDASLLYKFGENLGVAFQMQDDWLDVFGNAELVGKKTGGDILQNKKTVLFILSAQSMDAEDRKKLFDHYQNSDQSDVKVSKVKELFVKWNIGDKVNELKSDFHNRSLLALEGLDIPDERKAAFNQFAETLLNRTL
jgi:geranylgeranyl diphosphate synthase type II